MPHPEGDRTSSVLGVRGESVVWDEEGGHETRRSSVHGTRLSSGKALEPAGSLPRRPLRPELAPSPHQPRRLKSPQLHREARTPCLGLTESVVTSYPSAQRGVY